MFKNLIKFMNGRQFTETVKQELYVNYIKNKELKIDTDNQLLLLFNKKTDTEIQREANGVIFDKNTNKVVCACYPDFVNINNNDELTKFVDNESIDSIESIEYCEDGTVIRLYYYNNQWRTATKKCIDARYSSWSSKKSFDNIFWELFNNSDETGKEPCAQGINDELLDKNRTYIFILLHVENVLVVKHKNNKLIYKGSIHNDTFKIKEDYDSLFTNHKYIENVEKIDLSQYYTSNSDDIILNQSLVLTSDNINKLMFNNTKRGILFKFKNDDNIYKYDFDNFKLLNDIRGNEPLIRIRYLELLSEPEKLNLLIKYYPEYHMVFSMIYHNIMYICNDIYMVYRNSHIKHIIKIDDTHKYYRTIKQIHAQYKRTNIPITKNDILEKLKSLNTHVLKNLLGWI
jgi:hypothetical protein